MLNLMTTASELSHNESETESSTMPQYLAISEHSSVKGTPQVIRDWLMCLQQDSPASRSVLPEKESKPMTNGICGQQQPTLLGLSNPDLYCSKMCRESVNTCPWLSETCADVGMKFHTPYSLGLTTLAPRTDENECGLWPTPRSGKTTDENEETWMKRQRDGKVSTPPLTLSVKMFPTPKQRDWKGKTQRGTHAPMDGLCNTLDVTGGQLNPTWVELLMGWPKDWTCLNPISHIQYLQWLMGGIENEETRRSETMRVLRIGNVAEEVSREIGRLVSIPEAAVLLSQLCEHANRPDEARIFMACAETLEKEMRSVWLQQGITGAPSGSEHQKQRTGEYPDAMQTLSRFLAYYGETYWKDGSWENGIPRVAIGVKERVNRLKAIGNGQVPRVVACAWRILMDT
jgi:hypothetical protein